MVAPVFSGLWAAGRLQPVKVHRPNASGRNFRGDVPPVVARHLAPNPIDALAQPEKRQQSDDDDDCADDIDDAVHENTFRVG